MYRWVEGSAILDYSHSWRSWEAYTDTTDFADAFTAVLDAHSHDVDALAHAVEQFLLGAAVDRGVVVKHELKRAANPNKMLKSLAPWFTEDCRLAKKAYKLAARQFGRASPDAKT